jgi:Lon protease-like protein
MKYLLSRPNAPVTAQADSDARFYQMAAEKCSKMVGGVDGRRLPEYHQTHFMIVPIFPLPNVVLFPKTHLPLHIFEERYRAMTRAALAGNRSIVMVLLRDGWELDQQANPPVHSVACLGEIDSCKELDGGKYDIVLAGLHRVRLVREIEHAPYRLAEVERIDEAGYDDLSAEVIQRRNRLMGLFMRYTELATRGKSRSAEFVPRRNFEALVNLVATTLNLPAEDKQYLLEIDDITERCDSVLPALQQHVETLVLVRNFEHLKPRDPARN